MNASRVVSNCLLLLATLFATPSLVVAQSTGSIRGKIIDEKTSEPLAGVVIRLEKTPYGAISDANGNYFIANVPEGRYAVKISLIGYEELQLECEVAKGKTLALNFQLREKAIQTEEVQVVADATRQAQEDARTSVYKITPRQSKILAGGLEDIMRSLQAIPGVLAQNDFSSQLFIRGSGPDQNLMVLDDIEVFNPYRLYGTVSMFNPETVADVNLITGGFPAKYGDRLSAVLDVSNRNGSRDVAFQTQLDMNITDANVIVEGKSPFRLNGSWILSARRTYYDLIVGPILRKTGRVDNNTAFPNFTDFQARFFFELNQTNRLIFTGVYGRDAVKILTAQRTNDLPDSVSVGNLTSNDLIGVAWHYQPNSRTLNKLIASWYRNSGDSRFGGSFIDRLNYSQAFLDEFEADSLVSPSMLASFNLRSDSYFSFAKLTLRDEFSKRYDRHLIEMGAGVDAMETIFELLLEADEATIAALRAQQENPRFSALPLNQRLRQSEIYLRSHVFVQDRWEAISKRLYLQPGLRFDYYDVIGKAYLSPRFNFSLALDPLTTIRGAWGMYRQSPGFEKLIDQTAFFDLTQRGVLRRLQAEQAIHYVLGVERWLNAEWQVRAEVYFKDFNRLIIQRREPQEVYRSNYLGGWAYDKRNWSAPTTSIEPRLTTTPINEGDGSAYGIELLLERKATSPQDWFSGWASYALAYAYRERDGLRIPFNFDQRHTINLVGNIRLNDVFSLGVRWRYGSGFPLTPAVAATPRIAPNAKGEPEIVTDPRGRVLFNLDYGGEDNLNSARLPAYHRLDVRLTAKTKAAGINWEFYLDVINAYNRSNVIAYRYDVEDRRDVPNGRLPLLVREQTDMLPLVPTLGVSAVF
ncbi:MAG: TonB-dependent receptor [Chloroherpetonaceae bacterium]|nr:TonB-dependent receptor [Chloroherpetonaceae bacterium]MDW8438134.1 TonB-dependent receptor [Chloroherpetonaceae bacterium]